MIPSQRDAAIVSMLQQRGVITITQICDVCGCSQVTARRDLERLQQQGLVARTHGGAVRSDGAPQSAATMNVQVAQETRSALLHHCDVLIATPAETAAIRLLLQHARRAGIPTVAESTTCEGAVTAISIDDYRAGVELGRWVGANAPGLVGDEIKVLDVGSTRVNCEARSRGFADGLRDALPTGRVLLRVDGEALWRRAFQIVADAFVVHPDINVICGVNDDSALAALEAYRAAGRDEQRLLVVSFGLEGGKAREALKTGGAFKASIAMFPEVVGRACVDAAICAFHHCGMPPHIVTPHALVTPDSLENYCEMDAQSGDWVINWRAVKQLASASAAYRMLGECDSRPKPRHIGLVVIFGEHDWYRNVQRTMRDYGRSLGIRLETVDASDDAEQEIDLLKRRIGRAAAQMVNPGDRIILDSGRTAAYLAHNLRGRLGITAITNSVAVLTELGSEPGITVVASGGSLRHESMALSGPGAEATFRELRADKAFITGTGVSLDFGISTTNIQEAAVKVIMLKAAREVILLADHTKLGVESLVKVAPLQTIHRLVTDNGISPHIRLALAQRGIEVTIADD
jgi:DeoR/GlpR family transcriptional regulator of sugar metabolism